MILADNVCEPFHTKINGKYSDFSGSENGPVLWKLVFFKDIPESVTKLIA